DSIVQSDSSPPINERCQIKSKLLHLMRDVQESAAEKLRMFENPFPHRSQPSESYVANQTSAAIGADEVTGPERLNATRCADTRAYTIGLARILSSSTSYCGRWPSSASLKVAIGGAATR